MPDRHCARRDRGRRAVALVVALGLVVVGCSGDDGDGGEAGGPPTSSAAPSGEPVAADQYVATVRRTSHGIAHVVADDLGSLGFGQGYAQAEDHACTLFDQITKVRSERARYLGPGPDGEHVDSDLGYLAVGTYERAIERWPQLDGDVADVLAGYAAGVNAWLNRTGAADVPGWCAGEPWVHTITPVDLLAYAEDVATLASGRSLLGAVATAQPPGSPPLDRGTGDGSPAVGPDGEASTPGTAAPRAPAAGTEDPAGPAADPQVDVGPQDDAVGHFGAPAPMALAEQRLVDVGAAEGLDGSSGWALGADAAGPGGAMLVAEPQLAWEGELRLWEVQLTVPGRLDAYGATLIGVPGISVGFNDAVAFTPVADGGHRGTAYQLELVPGDPTSYRYDGEVRAMAPRELSVEVLQDDGTVAVVRRTLWRTELGPVVELPGVGWTDTTATAYRDANAGNSRWLDLVLRLDGAEDLEAVQEAHRDLGGFPWAATVVATADGRAWYGDGAPTPHLAPEVLAALAPVEGADPGGGVARDGVVVLDGSTSATAWVETGDAPAPGLVPFAEAPQLARDDWVLGTGDGHWLTNPDEPITGRSPLFGVEEAPLSVRTRQQLEVVEDLVAGRAGDARLAQDDVLAAALDTESGSARLLRDEVVARCRSTGTVAVPEGPTVEGEPLWPAQEVDLGPACEALADWDETFELEARGAALWRELVHRFDEAELRDGTTLWRIPFRPADPRNTPRGLARPPADGAPDPVMVHLGEALLALEAAGFDPAVVLREVQWTDRGEERLPIPGGTEPDGSVAQVGRTSATSSLEPAMAAPEPLSPASPLTEEGYPVTAGSSFALALDFAEGGPRAQALLPYGQSGDPASPFFADQTYRYSDGAWRPVRFTEDEVRSDPNLVEVVVRGPRTGR